MSEDNVIDMPVRKNVLGGTICIFKTREQLDAIELSKQEERNATKEISD